MTAFDLPLPGQSLTTNPKGAPYERPPEYVDLKDVLNLHMSNLANKNAIQDLIYFAEMGIDVKTLTEALLRSAVLEGMHSVDNSINAAPILHERITGILHASGMDFDEGIVDKQEEKALNFSRRIGRASKVVQNANNMDTFEEPDLVELAGMVDEEPQQELIEQPEQVEDVDVQGLMSRRT